MTDSVASKRLMALFDNGEYTELGSARMEGEKISAVVTAYGYVNGTPVYAFAQNSEVDGGAVGKAHAEKLCKMYDLAIRNGAPIVAIYDSLGAYVEDGASALNSYSKVLNAMGKISGVVPTVSIIAGVCAGSLAMIATMADFTVMTEKAKLYMTANPSVDSVDNATKSGVVSLKAKDDDDACEIVRKYLTLMPQNNLSPVPEFDYAVNDTAALTTIEGIADADSVLELGSDYANVSTVLCTIGGVASGVVSVDASVLSEDDCTKVARFVRVCDAYSIPLVTLVDTEGFNDADITSVKSATRVAGAYAEATCTKIAIITGKAYGAAFTAFAGANVSADAVYALDNAVIAPISPISAAEFLSHDELKGVSDLEAARKELADKYANGSFSAIAAAQNGAIDEAITAEQIRPVIISTMEMTSGKRPSSYIQKKHSNLPI